VNFNPQDTGETGNRTELDVPLKHQENSSAVFSNPIIRTAQTPRTTVNKLYGGYTQTRANSGNTYNYDEIFHYLNENFALKNEPEELLYSLHNVLTGKMQANFTSIGLLNRQSDAINIRLIDKIGSSYSTKVLLSDVDNPIIRCFLDKTPQYTDNSDFLNASYLLNSQALIMPMVASGNCFGVLAVGSSSSNEHLEFYRFLGSYIGMFARSCELATMVEHNTDKDTLTALANHKFFQEELTKQIKVAEDKGEMLSVCIFDISNISQVNRELGHAKGDEIIKIVAQKIKENIRNTDFAGRYGGDEIAIIMPNTSINEAKYIAEYLSYTLTCIYIDDVGPVKLSAGVSTYPDTTKSQEKLLILAEQAMHISKSKSYENGNFVVVTSEDFDFWDDTALKSFAEVLTKRHAQVGIDFEDELVKKFHDEKIISNKHLLEVVTSLAGTIDAKDTYTKGHSTFVSKYSIALARAINLPEAEVERIKLGAMLHDIGKIGIPEQVLRKPTMLTDEEWEVMRQHPAIGADKVLAPNESLHDLIPMVKFHHEHWDGSGYPFGLKGEDIPLSARIVAIADAYHALISDRPYRKGLSVEKACEILKLGAGIQWDRELIRHFVVIAQSLTTME